MKHVGSFEAKTKLPELLKQVEKGEHITITRHGVPIAVLVPASTKQEKSIKDVIKDIRRFQSHHNLDGLSLREMIDQGRN